MSADMQHSMLLSFQDHQAAIDILQQKLTKLCHSYKTLGNVAHQYYNVFYFFVVFNLDHNSSAYLEIFFKKRKR